MQELLVRRPAGDHLGWPNVSGIQADKKMGTNYIIRIATPVDLPQILQVQALAMRQLAARFYEPDAIEAFVEFGTMDVDLLDGKTYFVVERAGTIVATGGWSLSPPRYEAHSTDLPSDDEPGTQPTVRSMFVHPDAARQGIATMMMQKICNEIADAGFATAHLTVTLSGIPLYLKLGWRSDDPVTIVMPDGVKLVGLRMKKSLTKPEAAAA